MSNAYPVNAQTGHKQRVGRLFRSSFGRIELSRGNMTDMKAYARQVMNEDIATLRSRAMEAQCYKQACMTDPTIKDSMFALAVKVTLVAWAKRRRELDKSDKPS